eukprot:scaffold20758_cov28-Tisochrysis_lutea.AAC.2
MAKDRGGGYARGWAPEPSARPETPEALAGLPGTSLPSLAARETAPAHSLGPSRPAWRRASQGSEEARAMARGVHHGTVSPSGRGARSAAGGEQASWHQVPLLPPPRPSRPSNKRESPLAHTLVSHPQSPFS